MRLHGFTGSSLVFRKNIPLLTPSHRILAPDLRGHGSSSKTPHGYHVSRLAMDIHELLSHLNLLPSPSSPSSPPKIRALGASLGASILWSYTELFTSTPFSHLIFVDQSPLQNASLDGWDARFCNRGMNSPWAIAAFQKVLELVPKEAHRGTVGACLGYRFAPLGKGGDGLGDKEEEGKREGGKVWVQDEEFFLQEAMKGDPRWLGKLMEEHTALDWRDAVSWGLGRERSAAKVLVVASTRSGCFPAEGPLAVVGLVNGEGWKGEGEEGKKGQEGKGGRKKLARGVVVDWGGHWCYWEDEKKFNELVLGFLQEDE
ncbi:hypothetical protein CJF31_00010445 [Rutstroemia sp. NJR-2017a BVV2]|nr:hypothetical protein CJF31_00010445 [Rutstroemia sp. NJR-2017a BVV2]